jgi:hypothetical protein
LRIHDNHYACVWADREASGVAAVVDDSRRIEEDLQSARGRPSTGKAIASQTFALQAAALIAVKLGSYHDLKHAPAVILALLEVASGRAEGRARD